MPNGFVTKWSDRGFGFIAPEGGGEDVFVHGSVLRGDTSLQAGDRVYYETRLSRPNGRQQGHKASAISCRRVVEDTAMTTDFFAFPSRRDPAVSIQHFLTRAGIPKRDMHAKQRLLRPFMKTSSVGCPFLVISERGLLESMRPPSASELKSLLELLTAYVQGCESSQAFMLADFEGEMLGYCGELSTAAILETSALDETLKPWSGTCMYFPLGLLIDLRTDCCIQTFRPLMQSPWITKVMWGADADFESLMHQEIPISLNIHPQAVIDIQLAYSTGERRLAMARMLERVPAELLVDLPSKSQIDWHAHHSRYQRALHLPLSCAEATYAMDDLHRIEAILATQPPPGGSYEAARRSSTEILAQVQEDPCGWRSMERNENYYHHLVGARKLSCLVRLVRHGLALREREKRGLVLGDKKAWAAEIEGWAATELAKEGVIIHKDLSFDGDHAVENGNAEASESSSAKKERMETAPVKSMPVLSAAAAKAQRQSPKSRKVFPWIALAAAVLLALLWWRTAAVKRF